MTIARRGLKVKVNVMGQANAVGPTSMEGSFSSAHLQSTGEFATKCDIVIFLGPAT